MLDKIGKQLDTVMKSNKMNKKFIEEMRKTVNGQSKEVEKAVNKLHQIHLEEKKLLEIIKKAAAKEKA